MAGSGWRWTSGAEVGASCFELGEVEVEDAEAVAGEEVAAPDEAEADWAREARVGGAGEAGTCACDG